MNTAKRGGWSAVNGPLWPVALYAFSFLYYLLYYDVGISLSDPGVFVESALRILDGQVPYRDYFFFYPPGASYMLALLIKLFGFSILLERLLWVSVLSGTVVLTFVISRRLMPTPYSLVPPLLALVVPGPWHKSLLPFFYLLAACAAWGYIVRKGWKRAFACGAFAGFVIYFRHDVAGFVGLSYLALVAAANLFSGRAAPGRAAAWLKETAGLSAGLLLTVTPAAAFVFWGDSGDILGYTTHMLSTYSRSGSLPFPSITAALSEGHLGRAFSALLFYVPGATVLVTGAVLARRWTRNTAGLSADDLMLFELSLLGLFSYNQALIRSDWGHLLQSVHIPYILLPYLACLASRSIGKLSPHGLRNPLRWAAALSMACFMALYVATFVSKDHQYTGSLGVLRQKEARLDIPGFPLYGKKETAENLEALTAFVRKNTEPGEPVLIVPFSPMLYPMTGGSNPTYFDMVFPGMFKDKKMEDEYISDVEHAGVRLVVVSDFRYTEKDGGGFRDYARPIYDYIAGNFEPAARFGEFEVYLRR